MTNTQTGESVTVSIAGIEWQLWAKKALYLPSRRMLFVADTHLGKDATFRRHGIPVPAGPTGGTLKVVADLIEATGADHLTILGDLFHARSSLSASTCQLVEQFFTDHTNLSITLILGNHDSHVGQLPKSWPIVVESPGVRLGKIMLGHEPMPVPADVDLLLCGHIHPAIRIAGAQRKLPCFWLHQRRLVLPAIGNFTGTHVIKPGLHDQTWGIAGSEILDV